MLNFKEQMRDYPSRLEVRKFGDGMENKLNVNVVNLWLISF